MALCHYIHSTASAVLRDDRFGEHPTVGVPTPSKLDRYMDLFGFAILFCFFSFFEFTTRSMDRENVQYRKYHILDGIARSTGILV